MLFGKLINMICAVVVGTINADTSFQAPEQKHESNLFPWVLPSSSFPDNLPEAILDPSTEGIQTFNVDPIPAEDNDDES